MKNKKRIYLISVIILVVAITILGVYLYNRNSKTNRYDCNIKEMALCKTKETAAIHYIEEEYNVTPTIVFVSRDINGFYNETSNFTTYMKYENYNFYVTIADDGVITDTYMKNKLANDLSTDLINNLEETFDTEILQNYRLELSYYDDSELAKEMTIEELLNQNEKDTFLAFEFLAVNSNQSDTDLYNNLLIWLNDYAKAQGIDYVYFSMDFIDKEDFVAIDKQQKGYLDPNELANLDAGYVKRYVSFGTYTSNVSTDEIKKAIYTEIDDTNLFENTLSEE